MTSRGPSRPGPLARLLLRKIAASIGTVALAGGLMAYAHYGRFADAQDPFPHSVISRF